jgi:hypothetical protein
MQIQIHDLLEMAADVASRMGCMRNVHAVIS